MNHQTKRSRRLSRLYTSMPMNYLLRFYEIFSPVFAHYSDNNNGRYSRSMSLNRLRRTNKSRPKCAISICYSRQHIADRGQTIYSHHLMVEIEKWDADYMLWWGDKFHLASNQSANWRSRGREGKAEKKGGFELKYHVAVRAHFSFSSPKIPSGVFFALIVNDGV